VGDAASRRRPTRRAFGACAEDARLAAGRLDEDPDASLEARTSTAVSARGSLSPRRLLGGGGFASAAKRRSAAARK